MTNTEARRVFELMLIEDVNGGVKPSPERAYEPRVGNNGRTRFTGFLRLEEREAMWWAMQELRILAKQEEPNHDT